MFLRSFFSTRLKSLRKNHFLTNKSLAFLLNLKNEASIRDYEAQRAVPSVDVLSDITKLFGVSIDWLAGHSDTPYVHEILLYLEETHLQRLAKEKDIDENNSDFAYEFLTDTYINPEQRIKSFSLPLRANIIFLIAWCERETAFLNIMNQSFKNRRKTAMHHVDLLEKIVIKHEITTPVFDITKPIK